ncbi:MAG: hypothetical protein FLDDKLPJ_00655 [Phycisphaerae bacterium]|nr:hypothetical protein [Phycisphaerae bacterium]
MRKVGSGFVKAGVVVGIAAAGLASIARAVASSWQESPRTPLPMKVEALSWMCGSWQLEEDGAVSEEHWSLPAGGTMIGMARTVKNGRTTIYEFLLLEPTVEGIAYGAQPMGNARVRFLLVEAGEKRAVFANPAHDAPQKIIYERVAEDRLTARLEGGMPAKTYEFKRATDRRLP